MDALGFLNLGKRVIGYNNRSTEKKEQELALALKLKLSLAPILMFRDFFSKDVIIYFGVSLPGAVEIKQFAPGRAQENQILTVLRLEQHTILGF